MLIVSCSGDDDVLDLTCPKSIPERFGDHLKHLAKHYQFQLVLAVKQDEHSVLRCLWRTESLEEAAATIADIPIVGCSSAYLTYIRLALSKMYV